MSAAAPANAAEMQTPVNTLLPVQCRFSRNEGTHSPRCHPRKQTQECIDRGVLAVLFGSQTAHQPESGCSRKNQCKRPANEQRRRVLHHANTQRMACDRRFFRLPFLAVACARRCVRHLASLYASEFLTSLYQLPIFPRAALSLTRICRKNPQLYTAILPRSPP